MNCPRSLRRKNSNSRGMQLGHNFLGILKVSSTIRNRLWSVGLSVYHQRKGHWFEFKTRWQLSWWTTSRCWPTRYHTWPNEITTSFGVTVARFVQMQWALGALEHATSTALMHEAWHQRNCCRRQSEKMMFRQWARFSLHSILIFTYYCPWCHHYYLMPICVYIYIVSSICTKNRASKASVNAAHQAHIHEHSNFNFWW